MSSYGRVLAVDPGLTTGFAAWVPELGAEGAPPPASGQMRGLNEFLTEAAKWMSSFRVEEPGLVIAERFIITPETAKKTQAPWSLEVSGGLRFLCHRYGLDFVQQTPAEAKRLVHDDRLKTLGWYKPGQVHANDALRHLAYGLARRGILRLSAANE